MQGTGYKGLWHLRFNAYSWKVSIARDLGSRVRNQGLKILGLGSVKRLSETKRGSTTMQPPRFFSTLKYAFHWR